MSSSVWFFVCCICGNSTMLNSIESQMKFCVLVSQGNNGLGSVQRGAHIGQVISALQTQSGSIVCEGRVQPLSQLPRRVAALAAGLRRLGLRPGERVAIAALNRCRKRLPILLPRWYFLESNALCPLRCLRNSINSKGNCLQRDVSTIGLAAFHPKCLVFQCKKIESCNYLISLSGIARLLPFW
jgi:acyl-CoA synthetase (AMP-forming)/AMP-acid ligase II